MPSSLVSDKSAADKIAAKAAPTSSDVNRRIKGTIRRRRRTAGVSWCLPAACKVVSDESAAEKQLQKLHTLRGNIWRRRRRRSAGRSALSRGVGL